MEGQGSMAINPSDIDSVFDGIDQDEEPVPIPIKTKGKKKKKKKREISRVGKLKTIKSKSIQEITFETKDAKIRIRIK